MSISPFVKFGYVVEASGLSIVVSGLSLAVSNICKVVSGDEELFAEVIGFRGSDSVLMVYETITNISTLSIVYKVDSLTDMYVSDEMLGGVYDAFGKSLLTESFVTKDFPLHKKERTFRERRSVDEPIDVGVSSINALMTLGKGQRVGIMAGSGVGKSVLMSMIAKNASSQICVCALIGERSREVIDFIEKTLDENTRKTTIIISAPADSSPLKKIRATEYAARISEHYASQGKDVVLLFDSLTRYAHALREVGLAAGEPPTMKGYPPSVFTVLPQLVERSGNFSKGSITSLYTVLMDGDDENDPIVDSARSILDGHILLSRKIASRGIYPAIDISKSISRCMPDIVDPVSMDKSIKVKEYYSLYSENEELLSMGAYKEGGNPDLDVAIKKMPAILNLLKQKPTETRKFPLSQQMLYMF
jgi:flagellum-specific ATP synthase